jgi:hypothetical protein
MFRFTIRDLLWLTTVICLALGWGMWVQSLPPADPKVEGTVHCDGADVTNSQICFHSKSGLIYGSKIVDGRFAIPRVPVGDYKVTIEGDGVPAKYGSASIISISIRGGRNQFDLALTSK